MRRGEVHATSFKQFCTSEYEISTNLEIMSSCIDSTRPQMVGDNFDTRFLLSPVSTNVTSWSLYTSLVEW